jgi:hypothetical protein
MASFSSTFVFIHLCCKIKDHKINQRASCSHRERIIKEPHLLSGTALSKSLFFSAGKKRLFD